MSDKLAEEGAVKNMSEIYNNLQLLCHEKASILEKTVYQELQKSKFAIPSCSRYLARVIYKLRLNSWNTKYSQNVTCVCEDILSVKHILCIYATRGQHSFFRAAPCLQWSLCSLFLLACQVVVTIGSLQGSVVVSLFICLAGAIELSLFVDCNLQRQLMRIFCSGTLLK